MISVYVVYTLVYQFLLLPDLYTFFSKKISFVSDVTLVYRFLLLSDPFTLV